MTKVAIHKLQQIQKLTKLQNLVSEVRYKFASELIVNTKLTGLNKQAKVNAVLNFLKNTSNIKTVLAGAGGTVAGGTAVAAYNANKDNETNNTIKQLVEEIKETPLDDTSNTVLVNEDILNQIKDVLT